MSNPIKSVSAGSWLNIVVLICGLCVQYGVWSQWAKGMEFRVERLERDNRLAEVVSQMGTMQNSIGVMQNSLLWLRSDVTEIKTQVTKKGAQ